MNLKLLSTLAFLAVAACSTAGGPAYAEECLTHVTLVQQVVSVDPSQKLEKLTDVQVKSVIAAFGPVPVEKYTAMYLQSKEQDNGVTIARLLISNEDCVLVSTETAGKARYDAVINGRDARG